MDSNSITHQQNNGLWIRIPLLVSKVVCNEFEFLYLLRRYSSLELQIFGVF